jgi:hypothetical protein
MAMIVHSQSPKNLSHLPPIESIKAMMKHFEQVDKIKGENVILYNDPEYTVVGDREVIHEFNRQLKKNPT